MTLAPAGGTLRRTARLFRDRAFLLMWLAMLASTAGTFVLLLALSLALFEESGSGLHASGVFGMQWVLPFFAAPLIGWLSNRFRPRRVLMGSELAGGLLSFAIGQLHGGGMPVVFALLALRGLAEATTKAVRVVALKRHTAPDDLERAASLFNTSQYLGGALGGLVGAAVAGHLTLAEIAALDALTFLFAALCYWALPPETGGAIHAPGRSVPVWTQARRALAEDPDLLRNFHYLVLAVAIFQGFHTVARTPLPVDRLSLGADGVMMLQVLTSVAIVVGAVFVATVMQGRRGAVPTVLLVTPTVAAMIGAVAVGSVVPSLALYALFMFGFEVAYTRIQKDLVVACPQEAMAAISAFSQSLTIGTMVCVVLIGGAVYDAAGLVVSVLVTGALAVVWMGLIEGITRRARGRLATSSRIEPAQAAS